MTIQIIYRYENRGTSLGTLTIYSHHPVLLIRGTIPDGSACVQKLIFETANSQKLRIDFFEPSYAETGVPTTTTLLVNKAYVTLYDTAPVLF